MKRCHFIGSMTRLLFCTDIDVVWNCTSFNTAVNFEESSKESFKVNTDTEKNESSENVDDVF